MQEDAVTVEEAVPSRSPAAAQKDDAPECSAFECNICYDVAESPVVTMCGHLYCWPCLYRWMQVQVHCQVCPVCKAGIEQSKVIPIYGRGGDNSDPRQMSIPAKPDDPDGPVPSRPPGQRMAPVQRGGTSFHPGGVNPQQGMGIIPTLFGIHQGQGGISEPLTAEQQHQAFLSRLLLMLGSFVIMCLLLF